MKKALWTLCVVTAVAMYATALASAQAKAGAANGTAVSEGKRLFEQETFGGNGRTCRTCHSAQTGTVSPADANRLFTTHPDDPLFVGDGSDDGNGHGTLRIRSDATIMMHIPLAGNVKLAADLDAITMTVFRGIPTTINSPALDPVIMLDGRQPTLQEQAKGAIDNHAQAQSVPTDADLDRIKAFEMTNEFFSSPETRRFAAGGAAPGLPRGNTDSEKRGRRFFEDELDFVDLKHGLCASCHAGPMLNETNIFSLVAFGIPMGTRFQNILVSELNAAGNEVQEFVFNQGTAAERHLFSPDIGRSAITGVTDLEDVTFSHFNAFKIPQLRGISNTAPYFHDNSAKTLDAVASHYATFFSIVTDLDGPGPLPPLVELSAQDQADIVAFMKILR
jgi:cytochrome c peroxidase